MRHRAKFREDWSIRSGDMADFRFSRWQLSAILDFQKLKLLTSDPVRRLNVHHRTWLTELPVRFGGPICIILPNFVKIGRNVADVRKSKLGKRTEASKFTKMGTWGG